ncbi:hypothetical protein FPSE_03426 [Fusarium pseudograminearum CS3096]|uniref:Uncharacterized protein n=1 Tax=Fusarium pseudograminearum (strain CS3096) TaxID=1028729 RepID=K3VMW5_FUSPC|nr:hypothetical protein FPSE_03426 [Fusarium pseudograminearum CS3096]EKJ76427.1 hypothetical protein FPSE_03426 [Fusarium pseudograminearum CS3096]
MTEVITLNPHDIFNDFTQGTNVFLRKSAKKLTGYKQVIGDEPVDAFVLNDEQFASLQLYVKSALQIPATTELFQAQMHLALVPIHQHCEVFLTQGINPMIGLAHTVVEYSKDATSYLEALKVELDVICDKTIPPSSEESIQAKENATEILKALKESGTSVSKQIKKIITVTEKFKSETESDASALSTLQQMLDLKLSQKDLDNAMTKHMAESRESIRNLIRTQQRAASNQEYVDTRKWYFRIPGLGNLLFNQGTYDLEESLRKYRDANKAFHETIAAGDDQRMKLLESIDNARALINNVGSVKSHIEEARKSLVNIMDGMNSMDKSCDSLISKLSSVSGQIKPEAPGSDHMTTLFVDKAVQAWNGVLSSARAFAKYGLIEDAQKVEVPKPKIQPVILAAHYAGITVTDLAKMQLNYGDKIVIATNNLEFPPRMQGKPKALSILYRFGDDANSTRVFVCQTETGQVHTLTPDQDIPGVVKPVNFQHGRIEIHSIVYGLRQLTDEFAYMMVVPFAEKFGAVPVNNATLRVTADNDPWYGQLKTAAVFYSIGGIIGCASGTEYDFVIFGGN